MLAELGLLAALIGTIYSTEKPCCVSNKWKGQMTVTFAYLPSGSSVPVIREDRLLFNYDYKMKMESAVGESHQVNGTLETTSNYTSYHDYKHMKQYVITGNSSTCYVYPNTKAQDSPCVYSTLRHVGTFRMGSSSGGIMVNSWVGIHNNFHYTMLYTVDDCTPVFVTRFGTDDQGNQFSESITYKEVTQNMTSPGAFTLPDECKQHGVMVGSSPYSGRLKEIGLNMYILEVFCFVGVVSLIT